MEILKRIYRFALRTFVRIFLFIAFVWIADDIVGLWGNHVLIPRMTAVGEAMCAAMISGDIEQFVNNRPIPEAAPLITLDWRVFDSADFLTKLRERGDFSKECKFTVIEGDAYCETWRDYIDYDWPFKINPGLKDAALHDNGGILFDIVASIQLASFRYFAFTDFYTLAVESKQARLVIVYESISLLEKFVGIGSHWLGLRAYKLDYIPRDRNQCEAVERLYTARAKNGINIALPFPP